jgi:site-specific DNA recombinase
MRPMQAVIYCRVSTKEQTKNLSIPTQLQACRDYCAKNGLSVAREFVDAGESAKTADRTQLRELLAFCRENKGKIHAVIVYNLSRFSRQQYDHVILRTQLRRAGVTLRSATEAIDDSAVGKMVEGIVSVVAQFENDQKSERTAAGMKSALQLGRWTFKAPLGYVNSGGKTSPSLVPDPDRAPLMRLAFQQVADGIPVSDVLRQLNAAGLKGAKGAPLSLQSFRSVLRNPVATGRVEIQKWGISRAGDFEALIPSPTFNRVQLRLGASSKAKAIRHCRDNDDFPLRRFLTCARCFRPITGSWSKGRKNRYAYYHCPRCAGVRGRRESVESAFVRHLEELRPDDRYMRLFNEVVMDVWRTEKARAGDLERVRSKRVDELRGRLVRLEDAFIYEHAIDRGVYDRHRDKLQEEIAFADLELHEARIDQIDVEGILAFSELLIRNVATVWLEASLSHRQALQRAIFPNGLPFDGRGFGTATTCLAFKRLGRSEGGGNGMASPTGFEPVSWP